MQNLSKKQPRLVNRDRPILQHDNARPLTENRTHLKILELDLETIDHPPFPPDPLPTDYYLFGNLDNFLRGKIFNFQQAGENTLRAFIGFRSLGFHAKSINELLLE